MGRIVNGTVDTARTRHRVTVRTGTVMAAVPRGIFRRIVKHTLVSSFHTRLVDWHRN